MCLYPHLSTQKSYLNNIFEITICGATYPDKNYEIISNKSKVSCIEYIEAGAGTVHIGDQTFYPVEGDSYFLHAGQKHHYYSDRINPWKKYFINIHGSLLDSFAEGYQLKNACHFKGLSTRNKILEIIEPAKQKRKAPLPSWLKNERFSQHAYFLEI